MLTTKKVVLTNEELVEIRAAQRTFEVGRTPFYILPEEILTL